MKILDRIRSFFFADDIPGGEDDGFFAPGPAVNGNAGNTDPASSGYRQRLKNAQLADTFESIDRLQIKETSARKRWPEKGDNWRDMVRSGRVYTRVERIEPTTADGKVTFILRPEPGWEWTCQNCKTYSLIRESDMPAILKEWQELAQRTKKRGYKPPEKPTAATAGCPNCKYRPGAPE